MGSALSLFLRCWSRDLRWGSLLSIKKVEKGESKKSVGEGEGMLKSKECSEEKEELETQKEDEKAAMAVVEKYEIER